MKLTRQVTFVLGCLGAAVPAAGQLVTPKTIPVFQGDQFDIYPSRRWGMAGVSIALDDTLRDPFTNPAKSRRVRENAVFALPYFHSISGHRGGGKSVPIGGRWSSGDWSGSAVGVIQQLDRAGAGCCATVTDRNANNEYFAGSVARQVGSGVSLGGGLTYAGLGAIDGVDLLYAGSDTIQQDGSVVDLRLGLLKEWSGGRAFEVMLLHNRTAMSHDVHFSTWRWDSGGRIPITVSRWDHEKDRTNIWGIHTEYTRPLGQEGWRLGWLATANRLTHPKIPNYVLQNIPRDPGTTYGFNVGVGIGKVAGPLSFGLDVVLEPMSAETWADLPRDTIGVGGRLIKAGQRTIENAFRFSNRKLRLGVSRDVRLAADTSATLGVQVGLSLTGINYTLRQTNHVADSFRRQRESWMEWAPSFSLQYRTRDVELQYGVRLACATSGNCSGGNDVRGWLVPRAADFAAGGIIAAPRQALDFNSGSAVVHRFMVVVPIR
jgi:hypothetical protein